MTTDNSTYSDKTNNLNSPPVGSEPMYSLGQILFGEFQIEEIMSGDHSTITFRARQISQNKLVALKTLKRGDPEKAAKFVGVVTKLLSLQHKNIAASKGLLQTDPQRPFYIVEWIDGVPILDTIVEAGALSEEEEIAPIFLEILDAIAFAHDKDIFHGNIVSENILLSVVEDHIQVKITDFGFCQVEDSTVPPVEDAIETGYQSSNALDTYKDVEFDPGAEPEERTAGSSLWLTDKKKHDILMLAQLLLALLTGEKTDRLAPGKTAATRPPLKELCPGLMAIKEMEALLDEAMEPDLDWRFESVEEFKEAFLLWLENAREERANGSPIEELQPDGGSEWEQLEEEAEFDEAHSQSPEENQNKQVEPHQSALPGMKPRKMRETLVRMVALKETQVREEAKLGAQLTGVFAAESARVSPTKTVALAGAKLITAISLSILTFTYVVLNWDQLADSWMDLSMKLSTAFDKNEQELVQTDDDWDVDVPGQEDDKEKKNSATKTDTEPNTESQTQAPPATAKTTKTAQVRSNHRRFKYTENPAYNHWVIKEVGPKRRLDKPQK